MTHLPMFSSKRRSTTLYIVTDSFPLSAALKTPLSLSIAPVTTAWYLHAIKGKSCSNTWNSTLFYLFSRCLPQQFDVIAHPRSTLPGSCGG